MFYHKNLPHFIQNTVWYLFPKEQRSFPLTPAKFIMTRPLLLYNSPENERQSRSAWFTALLSTLTPRQNGRHFTDDIFKYIFFNENVWIPIKISLKFVPNGRINNIPALVQIMVWCRSGDKPLSEPMMVSLPTHICVTRPQWINI